MSNIYGYCRISTPKQSIERQIRNIKKEYPEAIIVQEIYTGTKVQGRKEFQMLLKKATFGDTIVFDEVSRMSRNAEEGYYDYEEFFNRGVNLVFLKDPTINTDVYRQASKGKIGSIVKTGDPDSDKLMQHILNALNEYMLALVKKQIQLSFLQAEKEVEEVHQRTREGIAIAKLHGKRIGTPKGTRLITKKSIIAKKRIRELSKTFNGTLKDDDVQKICGISRNTFYKYKKEIKIEISKDVEKCHAAN